MPPQEVRGFRLSYQQRRMWLASGTGAVPLARALVIVSGHLDVSRLKRALEHTIRRHEILRTKFHRRAGVKVPIQVIDEDSVFELQQVDLRDLDASDRQTCLEELYELEGQTPFDLEGSALLRTSVVRMTGEETVLLLALPALCADVQSLGNLVRDVARHYREGLSEVAADDGLVQYAEFSEWQYELAEGGEATSAGEEFWRRLNLDGVAPLVLSCEELAGDELAAAGAIRYRSTVVGELAEGIEESARSLGCSTEMLFLVLWNVLLGRLCSRADILVYGLIDGRPFQELHDVLGLLARVLPIKLSVDRGATLERAVRQLETYVEEAVEWQLAYAPPEGGGPWLAVGFEYQESPSPMITPTAEFHLVRRHVAIERFKLNLIVAECEGGWNLELEYAPDLFQKDEIVRLSRQFRTLVASANGRHGSPIGMLEILDADERRRLLTELNPAAGSEPLVEVSFTTLFNREVVRVPDRIAVVSEDQRFSFSELDRRAGNLAGHLRDLGAGPEEVIAIALDRGVEVIYSMIGVLKSGAAYCVLDLNQPGERLARILADSGISFLLTRERLRSLVPGGGVRIVCLDRDREAIASGRDRGAAGAVVDNLAYVVFTSGSTGQPKGVAVGHRQLVSYLTSIARRLALPDGAHFATVSTFAADLGNTSIFPSLGGGGTLHVLSEKRISDSRAMSEYLEERPVDCLKIVPSHLEALLQGSSAKRLLPRRRLVVGGEASRRQWAEELDRVSACRVLNHYGPSEATVGVMTHEVAEGSYSLSTLPLGRPLPHCRIYVIDDSLEPVPFWMAAELFIAGEGLARGYLNRPELTAERFLPEPFSERPGQRMYRTGDRTRRLPDGTVEFLGRVDHQVKIRGYRVELGEIDAALSRSPDVAQAVTLSWPDAQGGQVLVAYVVADGEKSLAIDSLRAFLQMKLPSYMIPAFFVVLHDLPLTRNGKIDRRALPSAEEVAAAGQQGEPAAPRNPFEEVLIALWGDLLGREHLGIHDNFFDLGGHSLLATQVVSRVRESFQVEVQLQDLFEYPTVAGLAEVLAQVRSVDQPPIKSVPRDGDLPVSFAQERLWFLHQLDPDNAAYNIPHSIRLLGPLQISALATSLNELSRRHETLRTRIVTVDGKPYQRIAPRIATTLPLVDLAFLPDERRRGELQRVLRETARRPFELGQARNEEASQLDGALWRSCLFALSPEDHVALLVLHHVISDAWSMGVLVHEMSVLYKALSEGSSPAGSLPELKIQYADYAVWQREWLSGEVLDAELAFWREQLEGRTTPLELPTDRPRPSFRTDRGAHMRFRASSGVVEGLTKLSRRSGATVFMTLLAGFQILLRRYSGQQTISVGTPIAGRNRVETEPLIGFFINTLVMPADFSGDPGFFDFLKQVRTTSLAAYAHQDLPFEKLVSELRPDRDLSRSPLFQVMLVFQNVPEQHLELPTLKVESFEMERGASQFDLSLFLAETRDGLTGAIEFSRDLFDTTTVQRLLAHYENLLVEISNHSNDRVSTIPYTSDAERHQLVLEHNDTQSLPTRRGALLQDAFEAQVARTPEAVALVFEGRWLSYAEIDSRAERLARALRGLGVGPEVLAGISLERSPEMVVALLGILKIGGAYVPLDPSYPAERLSYMAEDAKIHVLVCSDSASPPFEGSGFSVVEIGGTARESRTGSGSSAAPPRRDENLAYVIYTSGSTGRPKGVQVPHSAAVNFLASMRDRPGLKRQDVFLSVTTLSFDIALLEIFLPLSEGARVVLASRRTARDGMLLRELVETSRTTLMQGTPATWRLLLEADWTGPCHLKVLCGGEALPRELAAELLDRGESVWNLYGPTETAVWSSVERVEPAGAKSAVSQDRAVSLGRPIARTRIYLVNDRLECVPPGAAGELWIGGSGVSRGYRSRPGLTADRFLPDRFSGDPGGRLYRTGDLARRLADGKFEFLGRIDHQVKVRGFRIELGEVESVLRSIPAVREALVTVKRGQDGRGALTAYFVPATEGASVAADVLRARLEQRLPDYMVPAAFVSLDAFPLTPNGKIDRNALPAPGREALAPSAEYAPPRNAAERALAEIWQELLGIESVGIHDNFFELGGDSILSIQVTSRASRRGLVLVPRQLFEHPTIAGLAKKAQTLEASGRASPVVDRAPAEIPAVDAAVRERLQADARGVGAERVEDVYPTSPLQQGLLLHSLQRPGAGIYVQQLSVSFQRGLDAEAFVKAWDLLIERHPVLRSAYVWKDLAEPLQVVYGGVESPWRTEDWRHLSNEAREIRWTERLEEDLRRDFAIETPPLMRLSLIRWADEQHRFIWSYHHVLLDGWSMPILFGELLELYRSAQRATEVELEERVAFRDYIAWLRKQDPAAARAYWRRVLAGFEAPTPLGIDHRPSGSLGEGPYEEERATFGSSDLEALSPLGRRHAVTVGTLAQAAWSILLSRYSGSRDVLFGVVTSGRSVPVPGIESMIGLFINTLPSRVEVASDAALWTWLARYQKDQAEMRQYEWSPLNQVRAWSEVPRSQPLFESIFAFENYPVDESVGSRFAETIEVGEVTYRDQTNYPFSLVVSPGRPMRLKALYDRSRIDSTTVQRLLHHLRVLWRGLSKPSAHTIAELPYFSPAERHQTLVELNQAAFPIYREGEAVSSLVWRFEQWAIATPDSVAVSFEERRLTYRELHRRSAVLAQRLVRLGVSPDTLVGLCLERSIELVVAILGLLKAGGAYVALDPDSPLDRLTFMLNDALDGTATPVLVTTHEVAQRIGNDLRPTAVFERLQTIVLDGHAEPADAGTVAGPPRSPSEAGLAYVIYTSGSTGQPKGVAVTHANMARLFDVTRVDFELEATDVWTLFHSYAFDFSVWELWGALAHGGRLVVVPHEVSRSPDVFHDLLIRERVTVLNQTPSAFRQLTAVDAARRTNGEGEGSLALRLVVFGGEALHPGHLAPWFEFHGDRMPRLVNMYGITETTVHVTQRSLSVEDLEAPGRSVVGGALPDLSIHLLDAEGRPVPLLVPAELHVGGAGLARGYLGRRGLTAMRFVPHAFSSEPGKRLYRSGDLARWLGDGDLEYLGRRDHQVKIRGFRIELGEIESALTAHDGVREALVMLREDRVGDPRLTAYLLTAGPSRPSANELRAFSRQRLPEYMVPASYVFLDAFPLTSNHKVDRRALPAPEQKSESSYVAPKNQLERAIAEVWSEVLGVDKVGREDNFYDLGGHSLLMVQVQQKLTERLGRSFTMLELFEYPMVSLLAEQLSRDSSGGEPAQTEITGVQGEQLIEGRKRLLKRRKQAGRQN